MQDISVVDNQLSGEGVNVLLTSPNIGGQLKNPTLLVMHYTASGGNGRADAEYLSRKAAKASAHVVVGRAGFGDISQIVPFDRVAWHAGVSSWRGRSGCNEFSIGIEIDNYGYCVRTADGVYHPAANPTSVIDASRVIKAQHKDARNRQEFWEVYPTAQIAAVIAVTNAILAAYPSIKEIVGHEGIAPGRKTDPGPAFPWNHLLSETIGRKLSGTARTAKVNTRSLNVRAGPGTQYSIIGALTEGTLVEVIYDVPGDWTQIRAQAVEWAILDGYVVDRYLNPT